RDAFTLAELLVDRSLLGWLLRWLLRRLVRRLVLALLLLAALLLGRLGLLLDRFRRGLFFLLGRRLDLLAFPSELGLHGAQQVLKLLERPARVLGEFGCADESLAFDLVWRVAEQAFR